MAAMSLSLDSLGNDCKPRIDILPNYVFFGRRKEINVFGARWNANVDFDSPRTPVRLK
jgi:hypothetical protein